MDPVMVVGLVAFAAIIGLLGGMLWSRRITQVSVIRVINFLSSDSARSLRSLERLYTEISRSGKTQLRENEFFRQAVRESLVAIYSENLERHLHRQQNRKYANKYTWELCSDTFLESMNSKGATEILSMREKAPFGIQSLYNRVLREKLSEVPTSDIHFIVCDGSQETNFRLECMRHIVAKEGWESISTGFLLAWVKSDLLDNELLEQLFSRSDARADELLLVGNKVCVDTERLEIFPFGRVDGITALQHWHKLSNRSFKLALIDANANTAFATHVLQRIRDTDRDSVIKEQIEALIAADG